MAARRKSDGYVRLEASMEELVRELVRGLVNLVNVEVPAKVREALARPPAPSKGRRVTASKKTRRKRSPG